MRLSESDRLFLVRTLEPDTNDVGALVRAVDEDEDLLSAMLEDERLAHALIDEWDRAVQVSPKLFFAVLLHRVRHDLEHRSYTFERDKNQMMVIFDTSNILDLLSRSNIRDYLAEMLSSFARIQSYTVSVQKRAGIWYRYRFSDYDVDSLIRLSERLSEERRFPIYRRIADVCLFSLSLFSDWMDSDRRAMVKSHPELGLLAAKNPGDYKEYGEYFYGEAARLSPREEAPLGDALRNLSQEFSLAAKPLTFMADHYLGPLKTKVFLRQ